MCRVRHHFGDVEDSASHIIGRKIAIRMLNT